MGSTYASPDRGWESFYQCLTYAAAITIAQIGWIAAIFVHTSVPTTFLIFAVLIFAAAVFESFVYLIGNGALDWGPVKQLRRNAVVSPSRTTTSGSVSATGS